MNISGLDESQLFSTGASDMSEIEINKKLNLDLVQGDIIPNDNNPKRTLTRNMKKDLTQRWHE